MLQSLLLHGQVDFNVTAGRRDTDVPQPTPNDVHFHTCLEQVHGRGMSNRVGRDFAILKARRFCRSLLRIAANDVRDAGSAQLSSKAVDEEIIVSTRFRLSLIEPLAQLGNGVFPQRTAG